MRASAQFFFAFGVVVPLGPAWPDRTRPSVAKTVGDKLPVRGKIRQQVKRGEVRSLQED